MQSCLFFFFQAEDGIRDVAVTGVQTCALPILDIFKTHFADDRNILYRNNGKAYFQDATASSRLGVETRYVCWGAGIVDLDNDGYPDLFMTTGHVDPKVEKKLPQYPNKTQRAVFRT